VLEAVFFLLLALALVTLVGHGIWIALAWLIRTLFGLSRGGRTEDRRRCPFCQRLTPGSRDRCDWCGRDFRSALAAELADLEGLTRQLKRLQEAGVLEPVEPKPAAPQPPPSLPLKPRPSAPPRPPRKPWMDMLTSFLEERNIRWAELIGVLLGGLLMVGASVALVISLWEKLDVIAGFNFKFFVFVAYSSAVFGAGLFAHYRWKLEFIGRGLLVIGVLLVPLDFLAMASLSQDNWTLLNVAWEAASLAVFVYLVGLTAGVLVPRGRWFCVGAIVGNSAVLLVLARLAGVDSDARLFLGAGALPVAVFAAAVGGFLYRLSVQHAIPKSAPLAPFAGRGVGGEGFSDTVPENLDPGCAGELFALLGTAAFALVAALWPLIARGVQAHGIGVTLDRSSVLFALTATPILAAGLTLVRGMSRDKTLGAYRTAGTTIAILGIVVMLAALGMAWPRPLGVMAVGGFNAAVLVFVAFRYRLPIAHAGAIACAALVYLTGYHVLRDPALLSGEQSGLELLRLAATAESGMALVGLFLVLGAVAELLARRGYREHGEQYVGGCGVVAVVGLLLVTRAAWIGAGNEALVAMAVYGIYGAGGLVLNVRFGPGKK